MLLLFYSLKKNFKQKENCFPLKLFYFHSSFKIDSTTLDPDPYWANIQDPDLNSMYLDPEHCLLVYFSSMLVGSIQYSYSLWFPTPPTKKKLL